MKYLVFAVAMFGAAQAAANPLPDFPFVIVAEEITKKVKPDYCELTFAAIEFDDSSEQALQKVSDVSQEVLALLERYEIPSSKLTVRSVDKTAVRAKGPDRTELEILGYEAFQVFLLRLDDLEKYPFFVNDLISLDNINNFDPKFNVENEDERRGELLAELSVKARKLADELAAQQSRRVKSVYGITTAENFSSAMAAFSLETDLRAMTLSSPGYGRRSLVYTVPETIELSQRITVVYELK